MALLQLVHIGSQGLHVGFFLLPFFFLVLSDQEDFILIKVLEYKVVIQQLLLASLPAGTQVLLSGAILLAVPVLLGGGWVAEGWLLVGRL